MAQWTLYFGGGGIGFGGEIPSAFIDAIDVYLTKTPNAQDGSAHTASSPVSISGAGIVAPGAFYASGATLIIPAYAAWQATHAYTGGVSYVTNGGNLYYCLISGTSAGSGGPTGTATTPIVDNTVTWSYVSPAPTSGYGLTVAAGAKAQINGGTLDVQAGGFLNVNSLGFLVILSGGNEIVESGGQIVVQPGGLISLSGSGALGPYGEIAVGTYGLVQFGNLGSGVWLSGSIFQLNSGVSASLLGTLAVDGGTGLINIGDTASGGTGALSVNKDSSLTVNGISGHLAQAFIGQFGIVEVKSGGEILVDLGGHLYTSMPASNAGPLANDILSLGVAKSWGHITISGGPAAAVDDGYNVSGTFAFPSSGQITVSFATPMATPNYAINIQPPLNAGPQYYTAHLVSQTTGGFTVVFLQWTFPGGVATANTVLPGSFEFSAFGRQ